MNYRSKYTGAEIEAALDKIINNVTDNDELAIIIGNVNKRFDNYLPTSGGTINGSLNINKTGFPFIGFFQNDTLFGRIGFNAAGVAVIHDNTAWRTILTSAGGTINSESDFPLFINTTASNNRIRFRVNGADKALCGYATDVGSYIYNYASKSYIGIKDDGTPHYKGSTLLHSGNVGEYQAGGAFALLDIGTISDANAITYADHWVRWAANIPNTAANIPVATGYQNGMLALSLNRNGVTAQLYFSKGKPLYYRSNHTDDWKTIAFTDSNVASAQALTHSNGTVGAVVNDLGNIIISNNKYLALNTTNGEYRNVLIIDDNDEFYIGRDSAVRGIDTRLCGNNILLQYGVNRTIGLVLNSSGNVTIGSTDLAGTGAKLYVDGRVKVSNRLILGDNDDFGIWKGGVFSSSMSNNDIAIYGENIIALYGGNVLIGTTDDNGAKLQVSAATGDGKPALMIDSSTSLQWNYLASFLAKNTDVDAGTSISIGKAHSTYNSGLITFRYKGVNNSNYLSLHLYGKDDILNIMGSGNVLIGTAEDNGSGAKLQVNGDISMNGTSLTDKLAELEQRLTALGG